MTESSENCTWQELFDRLKELEEESRELRRKLDELDALEREIVEGWENIKLN